MHELFISLPSIGELYFHNIYLFYDEPLIFSAVNKAHQYYFVVAIPSSPSYDESWLIAPISTGRLSQAEKNTLEIRKVLIEPETVLFKVESSNNCISVEEVLPETLSDDMLPVKGVFLDYSPELEITPAEEAPVVQAQKEMRDIIEISLEVDDGHTQELPCLTLVDTLNNIQQLTYALAYKSGGIRGKIPKQVKDDCELCVTGMFAASVGVRLKSNELCNMELETALSPTLRDLNYLFNISSDKEQMQKFLSMQNPRVAYRFKSLISSLLNNNIGIKINTASPNKCSYTRHFTTTELLSCLTMMETEIEEKVEQDVFYGTLVGINVVKGTFELLTVGKERLHGSISPNIRGEVFSVPQEVQVVLEMRIGQDPISKNEKILYTLVEIKTNSANKPADNN